MYAPDMTLRVVPVPCLADNYAYLVIVGTRAAVVDPGEAAPVEHALRTEGVELTEVWCTHHHLDHVAGVGELAATRPALRVRASVYDGRAERIPGLTATHGDGERFDFEGRTVEVLENPGHTLGAISFVVDGALFPGDTLFLGGCGRVFEGTMPMMATSMRRLRALPAETTVYCGHEYTVANLRFALHVEPENAAVREALAEAEARRARGEATVPGTIERERATNPFFRFDEPALLVGEPDESFARLREAKNGFRS